jgi:hypothetical protein
VKELVLIVARRTLGVFFHKHRWFSQRRHDSAREMKREHPCDGYPTNDEHRHGNRQLGGCTRNCKPSGALRIDEEAGHCAVHGKTCVGDAAPCMMRRCDAIWMILDRSARRTRMLGEPGDLPAV